MPSCDALATFRLITGQDCQFIHSQCVFVHERQLRNKSRSPSDCTVLNSGNTQLSAKLYWNVKGERNCSTFLSTTTTTTAGWYSDSVCAEWPAGQILEG